MGACGMRPGKETCRSWTAEHTRQGPKGGGGGDLWSPGALKFLSWSPEPKASLYLEPKQKMLFLAKWSSGVKQWSPRTPNFPSWSPGALHFLDRSPGALNPFRTLTRAPRIGLIGNSSGVHLLTLDFNFNHRKIF